MKRETKLRICARFFLAISVFLMGVGVVLGDFWFLISGVIYMVVAMWEESDANALFWELWRKENKDLIRIQKERAGLK